MGSGYPARLLCPIRHHRHNVVPLIVLSYMSCSSVAAPRQGRLRQWTSLTHPHDTKSSSQSRSRERAVRIDVPRHAPVQPVVSRTAVGSGVFADAVARARACLTPHIPHRKETSSLLALDASGRCADAASRRLRTVGFGVFDGLNRPTPDSLGAHDGAPDMSQSPVCALRCNL
jgi:hypothetical protein